MDELKRRIITIINSARAGVVYTSRYGAICPGCKRRALVYKSEPWEGNVRIRHHKCTTSGCVVAETIGTVKSVEEYHGE